MQSKPNSGFMPLLVAVGIVSVLGMMSLTSSMSSGLINRKTIYRLNAIESFYAAELATWHGYFRVKEKLFSSGPTAVLVDNAPYQDDSRLPASDSYDPTPGISLNISVTKTFAPQKVLIRRFIGGGGVASNLIYDYDGAKKTICAKLNFKNSKRQFRACLVEKMAQLGPAWAVAWGFGLSMEPYVVLLKMKGRQPDLNFGDRGWAQILMGGINCYLYGLLKLGDGSYILHTSNSTRKISPAGIEDTSFDGSLANGIGNQFLYDATSFVGAITTNLKTIGYRFHADGTRDLSFAEQSGWSDGWTLSSGKIRAVLGYRDDNLIVIQRERNGEVDRLFGEAESGSITIPCPFHDCKVNHALEDAVEVINTRSNFFEIRRYRLDGTLDPLFGNGGVLRGDPSFSYWAFTEARNNYYFLTSSRSNSMQGNSWELRKMLSGGSLDRNFGHEGVVEEGSFVDSGGRGYFCGVYGDGSTLTMYPALNTNDGSSALNVLFRLPNGAPDESVAPDGRVSIVVDSSILNSKQIVTALGLATSPLKCYVDE